MDYLSQEEDLHFFDANEEEMMMNPSAFGFHVWNDSPGSVVERRRKFLEWMGVEGDLKREICVEAEQGGFISSFSSQVSVSYEARHPPLLYTYARRKKGERGSRRTEGAECGKGDVLVGGE